MDDTFFVIVTQYHHINKEIKMLLHMAAHPHFGLIRDRRKVGMENANGAYSFDFIY